MSPALQHITSASNPKIKWLARLHKSRNRRDAALILVEGGKEVGAALRAGFRPHSFFVAPDITKHAALPDTPADIIHAITGVRPSSSPPLHLLTSDIFGKVAYRETSDGIVGIFHEPQHTLAELHVSQKTAPLLLILESVEKPGNLGAIIRTADAAGVDAVIVADEQCDLWNPNTIRASVGTAFTVPLYKASNQDTFDYLTAHHITPYAAALTPRATSYTSPSYTTGTAFVLGAEHQGLSHFWLSHASSVIIPMLGVNDSLNVSVAAGILTYEAIRQREKTA